MNVQNERSITKVLSWKRGGTVSQHERVNAITNAEDPGYLGVVFLCI